jgi:hypothetical protein
MGLFEVLAHDDGDKQRTARKAIALASRRAEVRFEKFLAGEDFQARMNLIEDDLREAVFSACEEVGHDQPERILEAVKAGLEPKEARPRRPKMCPYHKTVTDISLTSGDPTSGYSSMAQHAWGPNHCEGNEYEGRCNFKPEMVTQTYWDERAETLEQKRLEREEQALEQTIPPEATEGDLDPVGGEFDETLNDQLAEAPSAVGEGIPAIEESAEPMPMAASRRDTPLGNRTAWDEQSVPFDGGGEGTCVNCGQRASSQDDRGRPLCEKCGLQLLRGSKTAEQKEHLKGVDSDKRQRQYEHIKESCLKEGKSEDECKELAARTVNKQRAEKGETKSKVAYDEYPFDTQEPYSENELDRGVDEQDSLYRDQGRQQAAPLIQAVREHALEHYADGVGWDNIVEAYDDQDLLEIIQGAKTPEEAIAKAGEAVGIVAEYEADQRGHAVNSISPNEAEYEPGDLRGQDYYGKTAAPFDTDIARYDIADRHPCENCGAEGTNPTDQGILCQRCHDALGATVIPAGERTPRGRGQQFGRVGEALKTVKVDEGSDTPTPKMDKRKWTPQNVKVVETEMDGSPHPTRRKDILDPADYKQDNPFEETDAVLEKQDVEKAVETKPTTKGWSQGQQADAVTSALKQALTAKDFVMIAEILATYNKDPELPEQFANYLATTNPNFDRDRFISAASGNPISGRDAPRGLPSQAAIDPDKNPLKELIETGFDGFVPQAQVDEVTKTADVPPDPGAAPAPAPQDPAAGGGIQVQVGNGDFHGGVYYPLNEIEKNAPGITIDGQPWAQVGEQLFQGHLEEMAKRRENPDAPRRVVTVGHPKPMFAQLVQQIIETSDGDSVLKAFKQKMREKKQQQQGQQPPGQQPPTPPPAGPPV